MHTPLQDPIVIVSTKRTPIGQYLGELSNLTAPQLGSIAIHETLKAIHFPPEDIEEVILGCVLSAGMGQAPARQAAIGAELPNKVACTTINKMCGSGMKAIMLAHDLLLFNNQATILAGGMESMSCAPYLLPKARSGYRIGHATIYDHLFLDGLEDAYEKGKLMGVFAENCADAFGLTRETQDEFALQSLHRAQIALTSPYYQQEIAPITITIKNEDKKIAEDELPKKAKPEKIPHLKPAFREEGTVTAANSSAISDGAAVHLLMRHSEAQRRHLTPLASIVGHATHAQDPAWFTTAPIGAISKLLEKIGWTTEEVDLFEINEAFAVVTLSAMQELHLPIEKVNVHGGACAIGHPIGASGARILTTLIYALKQRGLKRGVASLCIGGGEATAIAVEI